MTKIEMEFYQTLIKEIKSISKSLNEIKIEISKIEKK